MLFALGLEEALRKVWCEPAGKEIRLWNTGETWKLFDLGAESVARYGAPYFMIHRADLHQVLIDAVRALKPDAIRLDARCTGFDDDGRGVTLHLANGERVTGDALIGADGVHSGIRNNSLGGDTARFTGCMAWRGLMPVANLPPRFCAQRRGQLGRAGRARHQLSAAAAASCSISSGSWSAATGASNPGPRRARARNAPRTFPAGTMTSMR